MHREDDDLNRRREPPDFPRRLDSVHERHGQIENDNVRLQTQRLLHGFLAVRGLAADLDRRLCFQVAPDALAHNVVIVNQQNSYRHNGTGVLAHCFRFNSD
ncbi:MAG: hypothetical protein ABSE45_16510 [Candidatus Acidiferrales bacterium]|jgi:hypothetical protein